MAPYIATTKGVRITVKTNYQSSIADEKQQIFIFHYHVEIENRNHFSIQLLRRQWHIYDSLNPLRIVDGEGVIGEQPVIESGEIFRYTSGCDLNSEIGFMKGNYTLLNLETKALFEVEIPQFQLFVPKKLN